MEIPTNLWLTSTISVEIPLFWWGKNHGKWLFLWVQALGFRDLDILTEVSLGFLFLITPCPIFFIDSQCSMMILGDRSPSLKIGWVLRQHRMHPTLDWTQLSGLAQPAFCWWCLLDWWYSRYPSDMLAMSYVQKCHFTNWCYAKMMRKNHPSLYLGVKSTIVAKSTTVALQAAMFASETHQCSMLSVLVLMKSDSILHLYIYISLSLHIYIYSIYIYDLCPWLNSMSWEKSI